MNDLGNLIRELRLAKGYPLRKVAAYLDIDQAILSKIERGQRRLTREQVVKLAEFFNYDARELLIRYLSDRIIYEVGNDELAKEALRIAEEKMDYEISIGIDRKKIIKKISAHTADMEMTCWRRCKTYNWPWRFHFDKISRCRSTT